MKPIRFLIFFVASYGLGLAISMFLLFSARLLQESSLLFASIIIVVLLTALFSWLYFKGVKTISWRARFEAIGVWMGLVFLLDMIVVYTILGGSIVDINLVYVGGLSLQLLMLFGAAYITSIHHNSVTSPDLKIKTRV